MKPTTVANTRRCFFRYAAGIGIGGLSLKASGNAGEDPFSALPKSVWKRARNNGLAMIHRSTPANLSSRIRIVPENEPGTPLIVEGQVFSTDGRSPEKNITVYAYNTDAEGHYGEDHKEYPPRLFGWMKTDAQGRFELRTILPGHYPGMQVPAHVHFTMWGGSYPPQWVEELRFEGDRYITPEIRAQDSGGGEFRSIWPLTHMQNGILHCDFKARLQSESNFS